MEITKIRWKGISQGGISLNIWLIGLLYSIGWSLMINNPLPFFSFCIIPYLVTKMKIPYKQSYYVRKRGD